MHSTATVPAASPWARLHGALMPDYNRKATVYWWTMVAIGLIRIRSTQPERLGRFRVPLGGVWIRGTWFGVVPVCAIVMSFAMTLPVAIDIVQQALGGDLLPIALLASYAAIGALLYRFYGRERALRRAG